MDAAIVGSQRDFLNKKRKNTVLFIVNKFTVFAWLILMSELVGKIAQKKKYKKKNTRKNVVNSNALRCIWLDYHDVN